MLKKSYLAGLIIILSLIMGCGTTSVYIKGRRWAAIDIGDIRYIAILDFEQNKIAEVLPKPEEKKVRMEDVLLALVKKEGEKREISVSKYNLTNWGAKVSNLLIEKLLKQEYYKIMERSQIEKILSEQKLALAGVVDENTAKEVGKLLGVEAIIFGNVKATSIDTRGKEYVEKEVGTGRYREVTKRDLLTGKKYKRKEEIMEKKLVLEDYLLREVNISINLRMVNVEKGNILGAISKSSSRQVKGVGSFQMSYLPSAEEIGNRLTNEIINQMVRKLSPHYVTKMRTLEYGKDKEKLVKLGVVYAQRGLWEEALQKWNMALKINPYNASAYNNIGVYYEVKGLLNEALSAYKEALKINPTNKVYMENLSQIKREIAEQEKIRKKYKVK